MKSDYTSTAAAMEMAGAEFRCIHAELDKLDVPKHYEGAALTASQRVSVLIGAYKSACARVGSGA